MTLINQTATDAELLFKQIEKLPLFEIHRLQCAMEDVLSDPSKNLAIKRHLRVGMKIYYFCSDKNKLVAAIIVDIRKTRVSVINEDDKRQWNIPLYFINLDDANTTINPVGVLNKSTLKIGDRVGWHSKLGHDLFGVVEKRNPKTALIRLNSNEVWRVGYSLLFSVMDSTSNKMNNSSLCIEGEVIR